MVTNVLLEKTRLKYMLSKYDLSFLEPKVKELKEELFFSINSRGPEAKLVCYISAVEIFCQTRKRNSLAKV